MRRFALLLLLPLAALGVSLPRQAHALDPDVKAIMTAGLYGMGAGTVLGLASFPFTQNPRHIFIGTSVGLYLGVAVGLYYVWYKYDPENPLGPNYRPPADRWRDEEGVPEQDQGSGYRARANDGPLQPGAYDVTLFRTEFTVARF